MLFGVDVPAGSGDPVGLAVTAEELGFDLVSASDHPCWSSPSHETWTMLTWIAARTDPELAAELIDHEKQVLARVRENTHRIFGETVCADPAFPAMLDVVFTSMRGMALTYTFSGRDPDTEPMIETWVRTALALLEHEQ